MTDSLQACIVFWDEIGPIAEQIVERLDDVGFNVSLEYTTVGDRPSYPLIVFKVEP